MQTILIFSAAHAQPQRPCATLCNANNRRMPKQHHQAAMQPLSQWLHDQLLPSLSQPHRPGTNLAKLLPHLHWCWVWQGGAAEHWHCALHSHRLQCLGECLRRAATSFLGFGTLLVPLAYVASSSASPACRGEPSLTSAVASATPLAIIVYCSSIFSSKS